jgi:hypothetical protein
MVLAAILCNALTGLFWGGLGLFVLGAVKQPGPTILFFPFLLLSRFWTSWLLYKRDPNAYGRSLRTNLVGAALAVFLVISNHPIIGGLIPLELLAAMFTYLGRDQLPHAT